LTAAYWHKKIADMEFIIDYIVTGESGRHTLIGRCGDTPIRVGDEFQAAYHYESFDTAESAFRRVDERNVLVCINEINAYGKSLDELGQGMTGSIVVSGTGIEMLIPGLVLGGQPAVSSQKAAAGMHGRQ
jgi:hypothetical protein